MAVSTEVRDTLTQALQTAVGEVPVFAHVPPAPVAPAVVLQPDTPYLEPTRIGPTVAYTVRLLVRVVGPAMDNTGGIGTVEDLVDMVLAGLPSGFVCAQVSPPALVDLGAQGGAYVADVSVSCHATASPPTEGP